ncbi:MAG TPA: peptide ABC transporter substrate-binding protein [Actinomycetota bacterium]|nr:peptide ABC transporter substrate-binding protein [Actinomycetota bacterium]
MRGSRPGSAIALVVLSLLVLGPASSALAQTDAGTDEKIVFDVGLTGDITSPNPFRACCTADYEMLWMNYDLLFNFANSDLSPEPAIAMSSEHSKDYMTWTFEIRDDAMWHDGQPLTAEDIVFTYQAIADYRLAFFKDYLPFNPTLSAPNPTTLVWESQEPTFAPTIPPWVPILPKHVWEEFTKVSDDPAEVKKAFKEYENFPAIGSGPFQLTEWEKGQSFTMEARRPYWGGDPVIDEVVFHIYENQEAMVQALKNGEIQFAEALKPTLFDALEGEANIQTHVAPAGCFSNLAFNFGGQGKTDTHDPAIEDLAVRDAVAQAIDKQAIVSSIWQGYAVPGDSVVRPQQELWYYDIPAEDEFTFDLDLAAQTLEDAGYVDGDNDGVREAPDGHPLQWEIVTLTDEAGSNDTGKLIEGWLEQIGIGVDLVPVSTTKAYVLWADGDFDAYVWGWCGDPDPDFILSLHTTGQCLGWSDGCYSNAEFDAMYEEQRTIFDREERRAFIVEMQEFLYRENPQIVLAYENDLQAFRTDRFEGYVPVPEPDGFYLFGWGADSYLSLHPIEGAPTTVEKPGLSAGVWIAIAAGVVVIVILVALMRRRGGEEQA